MAKAKKSPETETKPKKSLAANRRKRRARANPAPTGNPPAVQDFTHMILPGFGAYGSTRVLQRMAFSIVGKKWPKAAKHAHAATGVIAFLGAWLLAHRWKKLEPFHDPIVVGTGIAAAQGLASNYLPKKYSWLLNDCSTADIAPALPAPTAAQGMGALMQDMGEDELDDDLAALEANLGSLAGSTITPSKLAPARPAAAAAPADDLQVDLGDDDLDDLYSGAFAN